MEFFLVKLASERFIDFMDRCLFCLNVFDITAINTDIIVAQVADNYTSMLYNILCIMGMPSQFNLGGYMFRIVQEKIEREDVNNQYKHDIILIDEENKKLHKYPVSEDAVQIFEELLEICKMSTETILEPEMFTAALIKMNNPLLIKVCETFNIQFEDIKEFYN